MQAFLFLLLYLLHGQPILEQKMFTDYAACMAYGTARTVSVSADPRVAVVIVSGCATVTAQEVSR